MAIEQIKRLCTVVLHDSRVGHEDVLCGSNVLPLGFLAYLTAPGAKRLCIASHKAAQNPDEISIHISLAQRFGFQNRTKATLEIIEDYDTATATHVELFFREQHLSRADMWRIKQALDGTVVYQGQKVYYLGTLAAEVDSVYISGVQVESAYGTVTRSKLIFRSGSARYTLLIEISKEMLEYWVDGDLMYERVLNGYLPELFKRWEKLKVRHEFSVVLFGRTYISSAIANGSTDTNSGKPTDFYYTAVTDILSSRWRDVLRELKRLFNSTAVPRQVCSAARSNVLEAIHMAGMDFANECIDPHLSSSGTSIIAITAGAGLFETDHDMLKNTTHLLMGNSIGVDIVALSPKPLHPVPLFGYKREEIWEYALPHWVDISFWHGGDSDFATRWLMSDAEQSLSSVSIPLLPQRENDDLSAATAMNDFDNMLFGGVPGSAKRATAAVSEDAAGSAETLRKPASTSKPVEAVPVLGEPTEEQPTSRPSSNSAKVSITRAKRESLPPHSLMATGRKISVGPKGLAPSRGIASTGITAEHAQHGKDPLPPSPFSPNESSSGIAKQIRQSLARKQSQQSLTTQSSNDSAEATRPISIVNGLVGEGSVKDVANIIQQNVLATVSETELAEEGGLSETPRAKKDPFYAAVKAAEAEGTWTTSPWLTLLNPCNPKRSNMRVAAQYRKWQHVFPRAISSSDFKWTSMSSPATLPLTTEYRPSLRELERYPSKKVRRLLLPGGTDFHTSRPQYVLEQLILSRLTHGFQIALSELSVADIDSSGKRERILVSLGNVHHELQLLSEAEIQIVEYSAETGTTSESDNKERKRPYCARICGKAPAKPNVAEFRLSTVRSEPDWIGLDDQLIAQNFATSKRGYSKMRFVLIPIEPPRNSQANVRGLSDEEKHIEGIQKLTQLWQRNRYFTADDQRRQVSLTMVKTTPTAVDRDPNPLAIEYQTKDPSAAINAYGPLLTGELQEGEIPILPLFAESELFHTSTFDVDKLVKQMQEAPPHGVEVRDRRWLARTHSKCFRGDEMVNWLLRVFKDIQTREEATTIGNELMSRGIFWHVRHKHDFRDGNYFYQIASGHRTTDYPDSFSMFAKTPIRSVPPTPMIQARNSPMLRPILDRDSESSGKATPILLPQDKKQILLSQMLLCNVDPYKKSDQLEIVSLHYDRIHNPENCYHIQLEWFNTTAKLVREAIGRWTSIAEAHGLRLVQLPLAEAYKLPLQHPFDQPVHVKLSHRPPERVLATPILEPHLFSPRQLEDPLAYQKALLRHLDFVLDYEAAASFTTKLEVTFSHGRPDYELTQFIHKSGLVLAQITGSDDNSSDFLLLPNRLASTRVSMSSKSATEGSKAGEIIKSFEDFCADEKALKGFYETANKPKMTPKSPFLMGLSDNDVPPMQLPPLLGGHRAALRDVG
jgi:DEP domain-containing protein 5